MHRTTVAIRHLAFEDLGILGPLLEARGHTIRYLDAGIDTIDAQTLLEADLVVVLGGPIGANDEDKYPFVLDEVDAVRTRLDACRPTLGICLGAQLIARALGAQVRPTGHSEIGYAPLALTQDATRTALRHLAAVPVLHWHNDGFDIPAGAVRLASTATTPNQAFAVGNHALALQFHLETPVTDLERWLIGHAEALAASRIHPEELRQQAAAVEPALTAAAVHVMTDWLNAIETAVGASGCCLVSSE